MLDDSVRHLATNNLLSTGVKNSNVFKIALIGSGQMFGEEDVFSNRNYTTTVTCRSNNGEVFCIKNSEFFKKFKQNIDSWKIIVVMAMAKEKAIFERVKKIHKLIRENKGANPESINFLLRDNILLN